MFHVGQKVVCVNDEEPTYGQRRPARRRVTKGKVYTVKCAPFINVWGNLAILVGEVPDRDDGGTESGFRVSRFRPIVEKKTDISIFKKMLTPNKVKERT